MSSGSKIIDGIMHALNGTKSSEDKEVLSVDKDEIVMILGSIPVKTRVVWCDPINPSDNYLRIEKGSMGDESDVRIYILNPKLIHVPGLEGFKLSDIDDVILANTILNRMNWIKEMNIKPKIY